MTDYEHLRKELTESLIVVGLKISALKSTLNDKQLEEYHNFILDYIESNRDKLEKNLSPEKFQEVLSMSLK